MGDLPRIFNAAGDQIGVGELDGFLDGELRFSRLMFQFQDGATPQERLREGPLAVEDPESGQRFTGCWVSECDRSFYRDATVIAEGVRMQFEQVI